MERILESEWLDHLPAHDSAAIASRRDLQKVNSLMGHRNILFSTIREILQGVTEPCRLVEIGAGDGTLILNLARKLAPLLGQVHLTLLDRLHVVEPITINQLNELGWSVETIEADLWDWIAQDRNQDADLILANLFLHHFENESLQRLMRDLALRSRSFIACEPRRSPLGIWGARLLGLVGCNHITRHDAVISVRAGFYGKELSRAWPKDFSWNLSERRAGLFSHLFVAKRL